MSKIEHSEQQSKLLIVYALENGSVHEGGGLVDVYSNLESATKNALIIVEQLSSENKKLWKDTPHMIREFVQRETGYWSDGMYYVSIREITIKN